MEVLGCSAAEVAATLDMSVPAVNSAIQRARATLEMRQLQEDAIAAETDDPDLVHRYVEAFERYDMDALTRAAPPGRRHVHAAVRDLAARVRGGAGLDARARNRLSGLADAAHRGERAPSFGQYRHSGPGMGFHAWGLVVLEIAGGRVTGINTFLDTERFFPRFGLPLEAAGLSARRARTDES